MAELAKRLCFYLADTFSGDIELLSNLLESARSAVLKAETKLKDLLFPGCERVEDLTKLLAQKRVGCRICGRRRSIILYKVTDVAIFLLANGCFERDGVLRYLHYLANLFGAHVHFLCDLLCGNVPSVLLEHLALYLCDLVDGLHHMNGYTDSSCLVCNSSGDSLSYPPRCVRGEFISLRVVEFGNCFHKTEVTLLDKVKEEKTPYVYQYATGYSAAIALSRKILNEGQSAIDAYLDFLSKGDSEYSIDLLKGAGVDLSTAAPIENAMQLFKELLDEFEQL